MLFLYNDPTAPEALLGEAFTESGFDVSTFEVVPPTAPTTRSCDVTFPDPTRYDVIVPLGARWAVYDDAARRGSPKRWRWCVARWRAGVGVLGVCFGGSWWPARSAGRWPAHREPEIGWHEVRSSRPDLVPDGPWFQWHFDRFTLPPGAVEVARNDCATQAFVYGRGDGSAVPPGGRR